MATDNTTPTISDDVTVCSVCFGKLKNPRYLPCLHTFCHGCLQSYIETSCKAQEAPVGFACPLCRVFVPAPGPFDAHEKWVDQLPKNEFVNLLIESSFSAKCAACLRDNDENTATTWCKKCKEPICENCRKLHLKIATTRSHEMVSIKTRYSPIAESYESATCTVHEGKSIKFFCVDHENCCCNTCVAVLHRKCEHVDTIENAAQKLRENKNIECLLSDIDLYIEALDVGQKKEEKNLSEIDDSIDKMSTDVAELRKQLSDHLEKLENEQLDKISKMSKDSKKELGDAIAAKKYRKLFAENCREKISKIMGGSDASLVKEYQTILKQFLDIQKTKLKSVRISIDAKETPDVNIIKHLTSLFEVCMAKEILPFFKEKKDVQKANLVLRCEISLDGADVTGGCFLPNEEILLAAQNRNFLYLCKDTGMFVKKINLQWAARDVLFLNSNIFVTLGHTEKMLILSYDGYEVIKSISLSAYGRWFYGISRLNDSLLVCGSNGIYNLNKEGKEIKKYTVPSDTFSAFVDDNKNIVHSSCNSHTVTKQSQDERTIFKYSHEKLTYPYGLTKDCDGNIYVGCQNNNNIHILSPDGCLLRILENINKPRGIFFKQNTHKCCVGSQGSIRVYEFQ